jgi:hypothetical protein
VANAATNTKMDDDDDKLTLRDKLAAAALPALMQRYNDHVSSKWTMMKNGNTITTEAFREDAEIISVMAYKLADAMRKARLKAFT